MSGLFFEDFQVGREYSTPTRAIGPRELEGFLDAAGIRDPLHRDDEQARRLGYRERLIPGPLVLAVVQGLLEEIELFGGTLIAQSAIEELKFLQPVHPGDSLRAEVRIAEKRPTAEPAKGAVLARIACYNQAGWMVARWSSMVLVKARGEIPRTGRAMKEDP